jgi:hypothetical protein
MWEDEVLEELYKIREEHSKAFNYDFNAIFADWQKRQESSGKKLVSLESTTNHNPTHTTPKS